MELLELGVDLLPFGILCLLEAVDTTGHRELGLLQHVGAGGVLLGFLVGEGGIMVVAGMLLLDGLLEIIPVIALVKFDMNRVLQDSRGSLHPGSMAGHSIQGGFNLLVLQFVEIQILGRGLVDGGQPDLLVGHRVVRLDSSGQAIRCGSQLCGRIQGVAVTVHWPAPLVVSICQR